MSAWTIFLNEIDINILGLDVLSGNYRFLESLLFFVKRLPHVYFSPKNVHPRFQMILLGHGMQRLQNMKANCLLKIWVRG